VFTSISKIAHFRRRRSLAYRLIPAAIQHIKLYKYTSAFLTSSPTISAALSVSSHHLHVRRHP
jgi:hypothetical protein